MEIQRLPPGDFDAAEPGLAELLFDALDDGASLGFLAGLSREEALAFWRASLRAPGVVTWVAWKAAPLQSAVVGAVQLRPETMPNGRHRAEVAKLLVHRDVRRHGVAATLMQTLQEKARSQGRWLLLLDTRAGSPAEGIYERWGWKRLGLVDDYAVDPSGLLAPCAFFTRDLRPAATGR